MGYFLRARRAIRLMNLCKFVLNTNYTKLMADEKTMQAKLAVVKRIHRKYLMKVGKGLTRWKEFV